MKTLIEDSKQATSILEGLANDAGSPLCRDKKTALRRVALDILAMIQAPKRMECSGSGPGGGTALLTSRERDVAEAITNGLTDAEIGMFLGISTRTVNTHRDRILRKLNLRSRTAVAAWMARTRPELFGLLIAIGTALDSGGLLLLS